jgi:prepilin-type N-terminal cleavage/methylation domain-containing protein/prepilin-type processing-associated H-X9-DG protein
LHPTSSSRRAFTLVELLATVAIVAALVSLLLPAAGAMRQRARTAACASNLRSLQLASLAYATDHAGWLVDARLAHGGLDQGSSESFVEVLARKGYCDVSLVRSPLDESPHWPVDAGGAGVAVPGSNGAFRRTSYGLNNHLAREFSPWAAIDPSLATDRLSKAADHASTVHHLLMAENGSFAGADHPHVEGWGGAAQAPSVAASEVSVAAVSRDGPSPRARSNWSFLDGHVETLPFGEVYVDATRNRLDPAISGAFLRHSTQP